ncbi:DUF397 domain-containing protein [Streptomyces sp. BK239]|uniref:DUF397 domain-containing protein n=1 Tax=Streptomyces sp. BK239 TaxID=2512155 RepID=UPI00102CD533|nr:DUF397 domain-containing protein [Streptomyces sp. BK239]RZU23807.1 uncharacterized protein DUF397 [Streptomyces sp. BK239]
MSVQPPVDDGSEPKWFKSSHSNPDGAACVEIAVTPGDIRIRDSKIATGPQLAFGPTQWAAFVTYAADR